jgi:two-component system, LytTR family, response regulator
MNTLKLSIRSSKGVIIIGYDEIMYCIGDGRYTRIYLRNGESHLIAKVLRKYEILLPREKFFRIHKSCIVNLNFIKEYCVNSHHYLVLNNDMVLAVAKRRCKCFMEKLLDIYPS